MPTWLAIALPVAAMLIAGASLYLSVRNRPRPRLAVSARCTGGGSGVDFTAKASNEGAAHAHGALVRARLGEAVVHERLVDLRAGETLDHLPFTLARPEQADLIPACNHDATTYGVPLTVELFYRSRVA